MNKLFFSFLSLFALLLAPACVFAQKQEALKLENQTLEQCIQTGIQNSYTVKNAVADNEIAKAKVGEVRAMGLPQVNASVGGIWNYAIQKVFIPANAFDPTAPAGMVIAREFSPKYGGQAALTAQWLLLDGTYFLGLKAAKTFTELSEKQIAAPKIDVAENVSKAFYALLITDERIKSVNENKTRLDTLLMQTKAMNQNGLVEKIDVDRLQVTHNNLSIELSKLESIRHSILQMLKFQMSLPLETTLTISGSIQDIKLNIETAEFDATQRVEYQVLDVKRRLETMDIKRYQVGYLPSLAASFNLGANSGVAEFGKLFEFSERWFKNGNIGVQLSVPIFDGLRKKYQIQQARLALIKTENTMQNFLLGAKFQAEQSSITLNNHLKTLEAQKSNMELAKEVYRVAQVKFREGVGSNIEILNAENELTKAQLNYYEALYSAAVAKVDLDKAKGTLYSEK
jgi:outer membrane protein TolC